MKTPINIRLLDRLARLRPGTRQALPADTDHTKPGFTSALSRKRITLAWANDRERRRVIDIATKAGLETTCLRCMPRAKLVVLRCADGGIAGWAGMDAESDPEHPEVFSGFVQPRFRGLGLGALLEHTWWAYIAAWGYKTAYLRMECGSGQRLLSRWLDTGYCRRAKESRPHAYGACRICALLGNECAGNPFLVVDVAQALAVNVQRMGPLDICSLPIRFNIELACDEPVEKPPAALESSTLSGIYVH